jgi:hypothetical protein
LIAIFIHPVYHGGIFKLHLIHILYQLLISDFATFFGLRYRAGMDYAIPPYEYPRGALGAAVHIYVKSIHPEFAMHAIGGDSDFLDELFF